MKRSIIVAATLILTIASIVLAQGITTAVLRSPNGDTQVATITHGDQTLFAVDEVAAAFGGTVTRERNGFKVKVGSGEASFAGDSRFAVVGEHLIEMPTAPAVVENRVFVPWQFFDGFFRRAAGLEVSWDGTALTVRRMAAQLVTAQLSVVELPEMSKLVLSLSSPAEYTVVREAGRYVIRFAQPIERPFPEQRYESRHVSRVAFEEREVSIELATPEVVGDPYRLDNPFRIVLDLRQGMASLTPTGPALGGALKPDEPRGVRTIVLDPGHGGKEVGAIGAAGLVEKEATLAICRKLSALLQNKLGARVILTRYEDDQVPLDQRTAIANQYKADLFLSVHLNAAVVRGAKGAETYFLSLEASDDAARKAAELENEQGATTAGGDLDLILWDLAQQQSLKESSRFAEMIQQEMNTLGNIQNRGVKQAPFRVLIGATMPAALVEVAFISNPEEEAQLKTPEFQSSVANALLTAVERYKTEYETRIGLIQPAPATATQQPPAATPPATAPAPAPAVDTTKTSGR
jgi:N-acetylmuramoyl-L-alanine amidase